MVAAMEVKDDTLSTPVAGNCTAFCEVCGHSVYNMEKHIQTDDHGRNVRRSLLGAQKQNKGGRK